MRLAAHGYETIKTERRGAVALITLNRPKALNALNSQLISEINHGVSCIDLDGHAAPAEPSASRGARSLTMLALSRCSHQWLVLSNGE